MKNEYTYKLVMQSEDKSRNILEMAVYGLVLLSVILDLAICRAAAPNNPEDD